MCSHYQAEKRRHFYEKRFGLKLPSDWEPPRGSGGLAGEWSASKGG